ncbi:hypothetical protein D3C81_1112830 [compost metagenome]
MGEPMATIFDASICTLIFLVLYAGITGTCVVLVDPSIVFSILRSYMFLDVLLITTTPASNLLLFLPKTISGSVASLMSNIAG